ncbi:MAG: helix-hairpin-helix domain-containing protein [Candidatus Thorarchaeota archaeon]
MEDVKGLGKKAENLKDAGIDSVENLANAKVDDLIKIKGIGKASAQKFIDNAKKLFESKSSEEKSEEKTVSGEVDEEEKKVQEELKRLEEKKRKLQGKTVEKNDFILVMLTGRTQKGKIFQVSSVDDAKKAGIYDEKKEHLYTPEFVIVGKPGFLNEGLMETIENMNYFEKKSVRIPPIKAFGKRDPAKIERIGIAKFRRMNDGKIPEIGQDFTRKDGQRGTVTNILQGRVIIDYNHPLAGQSLDYNIEVIDKIEDFNEKIEYFMISKGIPKQNVSDFKINYNKEVQSIEFTIPKQFLFQNLTLLKFSLAMDLQTHMAEEINDIKFIEIYEKMPIPTTPSESVMKKVEEYNKQQESEQEEEQSDNKK